VKGDDVKCNVVAHDEGLKKRQRMHVSGMENLGIVMRETTKKNPTGI
jgi:hypothetical protein